LVFRPFFLFGAIYAGLAVLAWLSTVFSPVDWHVHEMLYGYVPTIVTGFLLAAIPNWTGRLPIQSMPLLGPVSYGSRDRRAGHFVMPASSVSEPDEMTRRRAEL
jgi:hypothetical protein